MNFREIINQVLQTLLALDTRKKIALGAGFVVTLAAVILISFQASKPVTDTLYTNLSREDLNNMSRILSENGIPFEVAPENGSIDVKVGTTAQARMLLAEHGLPSTEKSGYELFDQVNTLGLTSFMQGITNKRAIEGELVRTIQMINGVNSARVHLVLEDRNVFRRGANQKSSASVVLKTYGKLPGRSIGAIRHMVAAAVPGLVTGDVTIVGADGTLLTTKDDVIGGSTKLVELEREYEQGLEEKILLALGAHIGAENLRVSASVKLNSDKRRIDEVIYDPDSKTERSVQVVKEAGTTENTEATRTVTIDQNLPDEESSAGAGQSSSENTERREELTNYEINEKKISLVSDGYIVENMSVAVLVNSARIGELLGSDADQSVLDEKIEELQEIVNAAVSASTKRGDQVTVKMVEFLPADAEIGGEESSPALAFLAMHFGSILNSIGMIVAAVLFAMLGLRPLLAFLSRDDGNAEAEPALLGDGQLGALPAGEALPDGVDPFLDAGNFDPALSLEGGTLDPLPQGGVSQPNMAAPSMDNDLAQVAQREADIRQQLEQMVGQSEERTAFAIKQWLQQDGAKAV